MIHLRRWIEIALFAVAAQAGLAFPNGMVPRAWSQDSTSGRALSVAATDKLLKNVRTLIDQHQFRTAERLLLDQISAAPADSAAMLDSLLGEVYFNSGQDAKALTALTRSFAWYERIPHPPLSTLSQHSRAACLLADVYSRQAEPLKAVATLEQMIGRYNHQDVVDSPTQLELVARLGELLWSHAIPGHPANSLDPEIDWLAGRLQSDRATRLLSDESVARGMVYLSKYQAASARVDRAIRTLEDLNEWWGSTRDPSVPLEVRLQMAQIYRKQGILEAEIRSLDDASAQARKLQNAAGADAGQRVRLSYELAKIEQLTSDALIRKGSAPQAAAKLELAFRDYRSAQEEIGHHTQDDPEPIDISDIPLLERIVDVGDRLVEVQACGAVTLADNIGLHEALFARYQQALLPTDPRIARLEVSLGGLYLENSQFDVAHAKLSDAKDFWSQFRPQNIPLLVQSLNLLSECDLAIGSSDRLHEAERAIAEAARLSQQLPPSDPTHWWLRLNRGRLQAAQGHYQQALNELEQIVAVGPQRADSPRGVPRRVESLALLQLGLLYKEQLEFDQSLDYCRRALAVRDAELARTSPERLDYDLALGELYAARNEVSLHDDRSLDNMIQSAEAVCRSLPKNHPVRAAVLHLEAMSHYLSDQRKSDAAQRQVARSAWDQQLDLCRRTGQTAVAARALHYLARLDFLDWMAELRSWNEKLRSEKSDVDASVKKLKSRIVGYNDRRTRLDKSRKEYRQAVQTYHQLAGEPYATQLTAFQALQTRLAAIQSEQKSLDDLSAALTKQQQDVLKAHSASAVGSDAVAPTDRARWLALLAHGDRLEQHALAELRTTGLYPSLQHAVLCNDAQILQAESQLDAGQPGLLERALANLQEATEVIENPRAATFTGDFMRAEFFSQYQSAFDLLVQFRVEAGQFAEAIVAAEQGRSRTLLDQLWTNHVRRDFSATKTAQIVNRWRLSDQPLLYYYVGDTASYLFVLGGSQHVIQANPLHAAAGAKPAGIGNAASSAYVAAMVERLRESLRDERSSREILTNPTVTSSLAEASAVLLPASMLEYLRQEAARGASCVTVVPHKAISQLPLEALVVGPPGNRRYLVDCCPPIVYAPSLTVLDDLQWRKSIAALPPKLLTLGDPDLAAKHDNAGRGSAGAAGLVPLPDAADECREIADNFAEHFGSSNVVMLTHSAASEARLRTAIANNRFTLVHMATHGLVGMERGQPFGWMVLSPAASTLNSTNGDGLLGLDDIRGLDLGGCELVALSACNTNAGTAVGRQAVRQAGDSNSSAARNAARLAQVDTCFSLASAFLMAGSRRVLATQWEVADPSTRAFMVSFFGLLAQEESRGQPINYARLVARARSDLRKSHPEFDTPFHWAPFVLIGPAVSSAANSSYRD